MAQGTSEPFTTNAQMINSKYGPRGRESRGFSLDHTLFLPKRFRPGGREPGARAGSCWRTEGFGGYGGEGTRAW